MSNDPYPSQRPDPSGSDPYSSDPYLPVGRPDETRPPAPYPATPAPQQAPPALPPPYAYAYAPPRPMGASVIVLVILSAIMTMSGYCCWVGIPSLVMGIVAMTKNSSDPEGADRLTRYGWITFAALFAIGLLAVIGLFAAVALSEV